MWNVDTMSLVMNLKDRKVSVSDRTDGKIFWRYVFKIDKKISSKLRYYRTEYIQNDSSIYQQNYTYRKMSNNSNANTGMFGNYMGYHFWYNMNAYALTVILSHNKVELYDVDEILENVNQILMEFFELEEHELNGLMLTRIDIKCDYRYEDDEEYNIIKNLINKAPDQIYHYKKDPITDNEQEYSAKWIARKINKTGEEYKVEKFSVKNLNMDEDQDTIKKAIDNDMDYIDEDSSDYFEFIIYDKEKEVLANAKYEYQNQYRNIIRTEVKIKNGSLNSKKSQGSVPNKHLHTFYNPYMTTELYTKNAKRFFGTNDFYRIDVALAIVSSSEKIRKKTRSKLCEFLEMINKKGYTRARQEWIERYSKSLFDDYKSRIESLGINILTFDKNINRKKIQRRKIKNFTKMENGIQE